MSVVISKFPSVLSLALLCSAVVAATQTTTPVQNPAAAPDGKPGLTPVRRLHKPSAARKQEKPTAPAIPQQAIPQGPLQPLNLDQTPAVPPQVNYRAGQLTITAQNCTLGDILRAVRSQTAAPFDVPPSATERVVGRFGPGPPREVLVSLLNGSHFDYVMLGSSTDPNAVAQLILTPKSGSSSDNASAAEANQSPILPGQPNANPRRMNPSLQAQIPQQAPSDGAGEGDATPEGSEENTEQAEQPENQGDQEGAPQGLPQQPYGQPGVKTPQQLLQELQQQQLQQQQLQQQPQQGQNPPGQPPVVYPNPQVNQPPR